MKRSQSLIGVACAMAVLAVLVSAEARQPEPASAAAPSWATWLGSGGIAPGAPTRPPGPAALLQRYLGRALDPAGAVQPWSLDPAAPWLSPLSPTPLRVASVPGWPLVYLAQEGGEAKVRILETEVEYDSIQDAINASEHGQTVVVPPGTHYENINFSGKNITVRSEDPSDPDVIAATIINGGLVDSTVIFSSGETEDARIEGLTITGGKSRWNDSQYGGGGILCIDSNPTIVGNVITGNTLGKYQYGAAIYCRGSSAATIGNNTISGNGQGQGLHIVVVSVSAPTTVDGNVITGNTGTALNMGGPGTLACNNLISANSGGWHGGGIQAHSESSPYPIIRNNTIIGNSSQDNGGGISCCNAIIIGNIIHGNTGVLKGGGIRSSGGYWPSIVGNVISGNSAPQGSGIYVENSRGTIANNTLVHNTSATDGTVWVRFSIPQDSPVVLRGNIVAFNGGGCGVYLETNQAGQLPVVTYCNVFGNAGGQYGGALSDLTNTDGNISTDPCFADAANDDFHLMSFAGRWNGGGWVADPVQNHSPCIDAGDPATSVGDEPEPNGGRINMGAYGGTEYASKSSAVPAVAAISPNTGVNDTTVDVTITGSGFLAGATARLSRDGEGDIGGGAITVVSYTEITCGLDLIGATPGAWNVVVANADGQSGQLEGGFTVSHPAPTVVSVTPASAPNDGPVDLAITGTAFRAGATVSLTKDGEGDIEGSNVIVGSATGLTCDFDLAGAAAGLWNVVVTNDDDQSGQLEGGFRVGYPAPTVASLTPTSATNDGAVHLAITGSAFRDGATVSLTKDGESDIEGTDVIVGSATGITCDFDLAGAAVGLWNVVVTNDDDQSGRLDTGFSIRHPAPMVDTISPGSGINDGSADVVIAGAGFRTGATARLTRAGEGDVAGTDLTVVDGTEITCTFDLVGAAPGAWGLVVINDDAQSGTLDGAFVIGHPAPTVTAANPAWGPNSGPLVVNVAGTGFRAGAAVKLIRDGQPDIDGSAVTVLSSTGITCTFDLTGVALGQWDVVVTNDDAKSGALDGGFTIGHPTPTITAIDPIWAANDGPADATITGTGFRSGANVKLTRAGQSDIAGTDIIVASGSEVTCRFGVAGAEVGAWSVVLTNDDAQSARLDDGFTLGCPAPTVTAVTPPSGVNDSPTNVTISGSGFRAGATVKLTKTGEGDIQGTGVSVASATRIECFVDLSGAAVGAWDVVVTNDDALSGQLDGGFTVVHPAPALTGVAPPSGTNDGPATVTIAGTCFRAGAGARLTRDGEADIDGTNIVVTGGTEMTCTFELLGANVGAWNVVVDNDDAQSASLPGGFTVYYPAAPTVTAIAPASATCDGPVDVTIDGTGFHDGAVVQLTRDGHSALPTTAVSVLSATQVSCTFDLSGAAVGTWNVMVVNRDGQSGELDGQFTVRHRAPVVTAISPISGTSDGTVDATITGLGFRAGAQVKLMKDGEDAIAGTGITVVNDTSITCSLDIDGAAAGNWHVVVTNDDGQSGQLDDGFTIGAPAPTVTAISPSSGINNGPVVVTITGTAFQAGPNVRLTRTGAEDIEGTSVVVSAASGAALPAGVVTGAAVDTTLDCTFDLTGAAIGAWNVVVTNQDGQSGQLDAGFSIAAPVLALGEPCEAQTLARRGDVRWYRVPVSAGQRIFVVLDKDAEAQTYLSIAEGSLPGRGSNRAYSGQAVELTATQTGYAYVRVESDHASPVAFTITAHSRETFPTLAMGEPLQGQDLAHRGSVSWYQVPVVAGQRMFVMLDKAASANTYLSVREGNLPGRGSSRSNTDQIAELLPTNTGFAYLRVESDQAAPVEFTITAHTGDTFPTLAIGEPLQPQALPHRYDVKWYRVPVVAGQPVFAILDKAAAANVYLAIGEGSVPDKGDYCAIADQTIEVTPSQTGYAYVRLESDQVAAVEFVLTVHTLDTFPTLNIGETLDGQELTHWGDTRWYRVPVDQGHGGQALYLQQTKAAGISTTVRTRHGQLPGDAPDASASGVGPVMATVLEPIEGVYLVEVQSNASTSSTFSLAATTPGSLPVLPLGEHEISMSKPEASLYRVQVPGGAPYLFMSLRKTAGTWMSTIVLQRNGETLATTSASGDLLVHVKDPAPGDYVAMVTCSSNGGQGTLWVDTHLPVIEIGRSATMTLLAYGQTWGQFEVPDGIGALNVGVNTVSLSSRIDVWRGEYGTGEHWAPANGDFTMDNPVAGTYYLSIVNRDGTLRTVDGRLNQITYTVLLTPTAAPLEVDNETVRAVIDPDRAQVTSLIFKPGSNQQLLRQTSPGSLVDMGTDNGDSSALSNGWHLISTQQGQNYCKFAFDHVQGTKNILLSWDPDSARVLMEFELSEQAEALSKILPAGDAAAGTDHWAWPGAGGVVEGIFTYPGVETPVYPQTGTRGAPVEGWLALWDRGADEAYGFVASEGVEVRVAEANSAVVRHRLPAGKSSISFHVMRPKSDPAYAAVRLRGIGADITVQHEVAEQFAQPGAELHYTAAVSNRGSGDAAAAAIACTVPENAQLVEGSVSNGGHYDPGSRTLTWNLGTVVGRAEDVGVSFAATAASPLAEGTILTSTASATCNGAECGPPASTTTVISTAEITAFTPQDGAATGFRTVDISGRGLDPTAEVVLTRGSTEERTADAVVGSDGGETISALFDLVGLPAGAYRLEVRNPSGAVATADGFSVLAEGDADLRIAVRGPAEYRPGRPYQFELAIHNEGKADAVLPLVVMDLPGAGLVTIDGGSERLVYDLGSMPAVGELPRTEECAECPPHAASAMPVVPLQDRSARGAQHRICISLGSDILPVGHEARMVVTAPTTDPTGVGRRYEASLRVMHMAYIGEYHEHYLHPCSDVFMYCWLGSWARQNGQAALENWLVDNWGGGKSRRYYKNAIKLVGTNGWKYARKKTDWKDYSRTLGDIGIFAFETAARYTKVPHLKLITEALKQFKRGTAAFEECAYEQYDCMEKRQDAWARQHVAMLDATAVIPWDPNDKVGPWGYDAPGAAEDALRHHVPAGLEMPYIVNFENDPEQASAGVIDLQVTDQLPVELDWSTFSFGDIQVGAQVVNVLENQQEFSTEVILSVPKEDDCGDFWDVRVEIECGFDAHSGVATWQFHGWAADDGSPAAFLPPNSQEFAPMGSGFVTYTADLAPELPTGTEVRNTATIDFEIDIPPDPLETPEWLNTVDAGAPSSAIDSLDATVTPNFEVTWSGSDDDGGSGILSYDIYVRKDDAEYEAWLLGTTRTSATFSGFMGHTYAFYSIACDGVGNVEDAPADGMPDTTTTVGFSLNDATFAAGMSMVSLPLAPADIDPATLGFQADRWARWNPVTQQYVYYNADAGHYTWFDPPGEAIGKGYWACFEQDTELAIAGAAVDSGAEYVVSIAPGPSGGWVQIGCPRRTEVPWLADGEGALLVRKDSQELSLAQAAAAGWCEDFAWGLVPGLGYQLVRDPSVYTGPGTDRIVPWKGYWMKFYQPCELVFPPVQVAAAAAARRTAVERSPRDWSMLLKATAATGAAAQAVVGRTEEGRQMAAPPPFMDYVQITIVDGDDRLGVDLQSTREASAWPLEVSTDLSETEIMLTWPDLSGIPNSYRPLLTDTKTGDKRYMRTSTGYVFTSAVGGETRRFTLEMAPPDAYTMAVTGVVAAQTSGGHVDIRVNLTADASLDVEVLNIAGRKVGDICSSYTCERGITTLTYNGAGSHGTRLPNGRYLIRVRARTQDGQQAHAMTAFEMRR